LRRFPDPRVDNSQLGHGIAYPEG